MHPLVLCKPNLFGKCFSATSEVARVYLLGGHFPSVMLGRYVMYGELLWSVIIHDRYHNCSQVDTAKQGYTEPYRWFGYKCLIKVTDSDFSVKCTV